MPVAVPEAVASSVVSAEACTSSVEVAVPQGSLTTGSTFMILRKRVNFPTASDVGHHFLGANMLRCEPLQLHVPAHHGVLIVDVILLRMLAGLGHQSNSSLIISKQQRNRMLTLQFFEQASKPQQVLGRFGQRNALSFAGAKRTDLLLPRCVRSHCCTT